MKQKTDINDILFFILIFSVIVFIWVSTFGMHSINAEKPNTMGGCSEWMGFSKDPYAQIAYATQDGHLVNYRELCAKPGFKCSISILNGC